MSKDKSIQMVCKLECVNLDGVKSMAFTKGTVYTFYPDNQEMTDWWTLDDTASVVKFWYLDVMFKPISKKP
tara:strand:- start:41 stop:253 length:213 start_codon:yes stop_codon:yes gene_type:complete